MTITPEVRKILILSTVIALAIGFSGGIWFDKHQPPLLTNLLPSSFTKDYTKPENVDFSLFWNVWEKLHAKYVDQSKFDSKKLVYGAIEGMVNSLGDPYTVFFEPVVAKKFQEEIKGEFGGVGMEIGKRNGVLTVIAPIKDTPAFRAGIKAGDKILKVDTKSTADMTVEEAVNLIRGIIGTKVKVLIASTDNSQRTVELTRAAIKVPTVDIKYFNNNTVTYIAVYSFNEHVEEEFKKAAQAAIANHAQRLIIDLRNNPGGLLDAAVNLAGWFTDPNSLVTTEAFGDGTKNEFRTDANGALKQIPTVVLINEGSASASEILAGALHDDRGIKLIGMKSFGKGSVQQLEQFDDGSSLKVTVAKWLTPAGISISEKGISPDIEVKIDEQAAKDGKLEAGVPGKDPQLDKGLEIVNSL